MSLGGIFIQFEGCPILVTTCQLCESNERKMQITYRRLSTQFVSQIGLEPSSPPVVTKIKKIQLEENLVDFKTGQKDALGVEIPASASCPAKNFKCKHCARLVIMQECVCSNAFKRFTRPNAYPQRMLMKPMNDQLLNRLRFKLFIFHLQISTLRKSLTFSSFFCLSHCI